MFVGTQVDIMFCKKADSVCCLLSYVFFLCFYYAEAGMPRSRAAQCAAGPRPAPFRCPPYRCRAWIIVKKVDKYAIIKDTKRMSKNVNKEKPQMHQRIQTNHRQSILHSDNDWLPCSHEHHISTLCRVLMVIAAPITNSLTILRLPEIRIMLISAAVLLLRDARLFFYLCVILDLFSRKVIAYKLSRKNDFKLALGSLYGCQK